MNIIDFLTLLLVNMAGGLFLLSLFVYRGLGYENQKNWTPGFLIAGFIALINGLWVMWNWPLPGSYNVAYGEMSVLFGILFLAFGFSLLKDLDLFSITIYALFCGVSATVIGVRIINLGMTKTPLISGVGFILTGLIGVFSYPILRLKKYKTLRIIMAIIILLIAMQWAYTGYLAYWDHLSTFSKWVPITMK